MLFTGRQIEELRDAIADAFAFPPDALEQALLFKLDKVVLGRIVARGPLDDVAYKLILLAEAGKADAFGKNHS